jgi:IS30 family transposase
MIDQSTRAAILQLHKLGHGLRSIAKALKVSRNSVKRVLQSGTAEAPVFQRECKADEHHERIVELHRSCTYVGT